MVQAVGCNVCLLEYRGYGHSDGSPSEEGMYMDAQAGLDHLSQRSDIDPNKVLVFGRSLGGAVAIEIASRCENREKISGLIVENTFTSIPDIARTLFSFRMVRMIPTWFYKNQFKSRWKVCRICVPVLFLSGTADQLIPSKMMTDLYSACGAEFKSLARFPNGTHNETWTCPHYYHAMLYFMEEVILMRYYIIGGAGLKYIYIFSQGCQSHIACQRRPNSTASGSSQRNDTHLKLDVKCVMSSASVAEL